MTISTVQIDETNNIVNLVSGADVITATAAELAAIQAASSPSGVNPFITDSAADSLIASHAALVNAVHGLTTNISAALAAAPTPGATSPFVTSALVVVVSAVGNSNYTTLRSALTAVGSPVDSAHRAEIMIYGDTTETAGVITIPQFVSVKGSKKDTVITCDGLKIGDGATLQHRGELKNIHIANLGGGTIGLNIDEADEITMDTCGVSGFTTGLRLGGGTYGAGLIQMYDTGISGNGVGVSIELASVVNLRGCNFYDNDTLFDIKSVVQLALTDCAIEDFDTAFLFDSTLTGVGAHGINVENCRFLCSRGGGTYTTRIVRSVAPNDTYANIVRGLNFVDNTFYLTAAKYLVEVVWTGHAGGGGDRFVCSIDRNYLMTATYTTAWFVSDNPYAGLVHVMFGSNLSPDAVLIQDGAQPVVTGFVHTKFDGEASGTLLKTKFGAGGDVISVLHHGFATLVAGTVTVTATWAQTTCLYFINHVNPGGTVGILQISAVSAGASFTITSTNAADTSVVTWLAIEP